MSCLRPKPAVLVSGDTKTGHQLKFLNQFDVTDYQALKAFYGDDLLLIPCGHCTDCIERRCKSWAIRCTLEAGQYENNSFITLTYNDKSLPKHGLCKRDVQKFIKRLRNKFGKGIRYFGCGEYGTLGRAHYHAILFNFWPDDAKLCKYDPITGVSYFKSKVLQELWPFGFVSIGEVSYNSCAYVARYVQKKMCQELGLADVNPEFSFMSRRPGIGEVYFREHYKSLVETDTIYAHINNSFSFSSFRYFDKLIDRIDPDKLAELKAARIKAGRLSVSHELLARNLPALADFLQYQSNVYDEKYNRLKRRIS